MPTPENTIILFEVVRKGFSLRSNQFSFPLLGDKMYSVLVVDDDTTYLLVVKTCLEKWNYQGNLFKTQYYKRNFLCILMLFLENCCIFL